MKLTQWLVIKIEGDVAEQSEPSYDVFPSSLEIHGDWRIVAEWGEFSKEDSG